MPAADTPGRKHSDARSTPNFDRRDVTTVFGDHDVASIYDTIQKQQTTLGAEGRLMAFEEFNQLIGVEEKYKLAETYGVK